MRFPLVALALAMAAIANPAGAQPAAAPTTLTLNEAMRLAEAAHPSVRAREALGEERERLWQLWRTVDPQLDGYAVQRAVEAPVVVIEPRDGTL